MAEVRLSEVTKRFGDVVAVNAVSLEIHDKEFLVLVGPSGCGKTTCLRMIAGLEEVTAGEIHIDSRLVNDVPPKDRDIAMVFQNYALYPHMTVYNNMAFGLRLRRLPTQRVGPVRLSRRQFSTEEIDRRVKEAARMLGLDGLLHRKPRELSGGQRQRVALGRAIVREPKVFLMDEPLSNLDAKLRVQTRAELIKLHRNLGITTVYVTHDQTEAMTMGDRIAVMQDGLIQQVDSPLNLYNQPVNRFVAGFIGSPQMNFVPARLVAENGGVWVDAETFRVRLPAERAEQAGSRAGQDVTFGIRPEDIAGTGLCSFPVTPGNTIEAVVEVTEPMGATSFLYLSSGPHTLIASVDAQTELPEGKVGKLALNMQKAHLFDNQTEETLF